MIAQNLSEEDKRLAHIIGLYHDIGRFEQDKVFNSFYDIKTFDHGDYGVEVLFEQGLIREIPIEEKYYKIIEKAIKNHNKYNIHLYLIHYLPIVPMSYLL
jgi:putative nucleotidyltransferase with HDIG domain